MLIIIATVFATVTTMVVYMRAQDRKQAALYHAVQVAIRESYPKTTVRDGRI